MSATAILDRLAEHVATVNRLTAEASRIDAGHATTRRELEAAEQAVANYHRNNPDAFEQPDDDGLDVLIADLQRVRSRVDVNAPRGQIDIALRSKGDKLRRQAAEAAVERDEFVVRNSGAIIDAMLAASYAAEADQNAKAEAFRASTEAWTAHLQAWRPLLGPLGLSARDLPHTNPAGDAVQAIAYHLANGNTTPAPQSLVRQPDAITIDHRTTQREPVGTAQ